MTMIPVLSLVVAILAVFIGPLVRGVFPLPKALLGVLRSNPRNFWIRLDSMV